MKMMIWGFNFLNMKKIIFMVFMCLSLVASGQTYLDSLYQQVEKDKYEKAEKEKTRLTEAVNMLLRKTDGEEVIGGYTFIKSNYGYYVLTDCPREKYRKFSHNFFRETNSKPSYGKYSKPRNGKDWEIRKDDIYINTYYAEEIGVLCLKITTDVLQLRNPFIYTSSIENNIYVGSGCDYYNILSHIRFEAARARAIIGARVRSGRYF